MDDFTTFLRKNALWLLFAAAVFMGLVTSGPERAIYLLGAIMVGLKLLHERKLLLEIERLYNELTGKVSDLKETLQQSEQKTDQRLQDTDETISQLRGDVTRKLAAVEERLKELEAVPRTAHQNLPAARATKGNSLPPIAAAALGLLLVFSIGYPIFMMPRYEDQIESLRTRISDTLSNSGHADRVLKKQLSNVSEEIEILKSIADNRYKNVNQSLTYLETCSVQSGCYRGQAADSPSSTVTYSNRSGSPSVTTQVKPRRGNYSRVKRTPAPSASQLITTIEDVADEPASPDLSAE